MRYLKKYNESSSDKSKYLDLVDILQDFFDENGYGMIPSTIPYQSDEHENYIVDGNKCWDFYHARTADRNSNIESIKIYNLTDNELSKLKNYVISENDRVRSLIGLNILISDCEVVEDNINDVTIKFVDDLSYERVKRSAIDSSLTKYLSDFDSDKFLSLSVEKKDEIIELVDKIKEIMGK